MKNVLKLVKKSFKGIPIAIFIYEMFNLVLSIEVGQYVKIDGFNLNRLITDYIEYGFIGFAITFVANYLKYNIKDSNKNGIQRSKSIVNLLATIMILIILVSSAIEGEIAIGLVINSMISLIVCLILFVIFLFDKKDVKEINKKIQEKQDKRD